MKKSLRKDVTWFLFFRQIQPHNTDDEFYDAHDEFQNGEFYLRFCFDVILEVLQFGDRRSLVKLERVGRRLHLIIERQFLDVPFLRLDLKLFPATGYLFFLPHNCNQTIKRYICCWRFC